jgi:hypothetical protein
MASYTALQSQNLVTAATALKIQAFEKLVQMKSLPESIFFHLSGNVIDKMTPIPAAWLLKMPPEAGQAHQTNFPLLMWLSGQETKGNVADEINNVEDPVIKQFTAYYNDVSHSVKLDQYGISYLDTAPYAIKDKVADLLATYWKELMDYYMQYTILWQVSPNLLESPTNLSVLAHKNTFVKGVNLPNQPWTLYNTNANFFSGIIASALDLAKNNHSNTYEMGFDFPFALSMAQWANYTGKIKPFNLGGRGSYIYAIPSSQVTRTLNPISNGSFAAIWEATTKLNTEEASLPLVLGRARNVIFVENPRAPTAKTYGSGSGSGSGLGTTSPYNSVLEVKYLKPGENDQRHTSGDIWEPGFLMGMHGIAEVDAGVHTEYEVQDFKRFKATGMFDTMGFNRVEYQPSSGVTASTTTTTTSFDNFSSAVTWFYQQNAYFNIASGQTY